jgi:hypothetical protein
VKEVDTEKSLRLSEALLTALEPILQTKESTMVAHESKASRHTDSQLTHQDNQKDFGGLRRNIISGAAIVATMGLPTPARDKSRVFLKNELPSSRRHEYKVPHVSSWTQTSDAFRTNKQIGRRDDPPPISLAS